jgi:sugar/nucleoside kinase (ribokinase family)
VRPRTIRPTTSSRAPRLAALGDLLLDVVVAPEGPIERGTDVPGTVTFRRGGSAATTAAAFARLGGEASLITSLGDDALGTRLSASMRADGVRVHATRSDEPSGRLAAVIDANGERSFVTQRGAADHLRPTSLKPTWLRGIDVLHVPAYSLLAEPIGSAAIHAVELARTHGAIISVDLSSSGPLRAFGIRRSKARLRAVGPDLVFANRDEAAVIAGRPGMRAWPRLLRFAPLVVVKDGAAGCRVLQQDPIDPATSTQLDVAARRIGIVDSTGAGDAFAAGFLYALLVAQRVGAPTSTGPWSATALRRAALSGHRTAADALRRPRVPISLG